jgi:hypothetical protein
VYHLLNYGIDGGFSRAIAILKEACSEHLADSCSSEYHSSMRRPELGMLGESHM